MKKTALIASCILVILALVCFVPIPKGSLDDGGTRVYDALTYKLVRWNRLTDDGVHRQLRLYIGEDKSCTIDELWQQELPHVPHRFDAVLTELTNTHATVEAMAYESESGLFSFSIADLDVSGMQIGDIVHMFYTGDIMETYPAQIHVTSIVAQHDLRMIDYEDVWLDKSIAQLYDESESDSDLVIIDIYNNCFFARSVVPMPTIWKINGTLGDEWSVGDQVEVTYTNRYYDSGSDRCEADMLAIDISDFKPDPFAAYKPVIYLYPEAETDVDVTLTLDGKLTCTYPAYRDGWHVTAAPDGTLTDADGQTYNYLYWEGLTDADFTIEEGFCVKGDDTAVFLESALAQLGLTRREANEFIVYWLPLMQDNPYNLISFQTTAYTEAAELIVSPAPDTLIRVFMTWQASDTAIDLPAQILQAPARDGFTVVEWGGTQL